MVWAVNGGEARRGTWRVVMCPELGLRCNGAAGDRIGEANFESQAIGEGTVGQGTCGPWWYHAVREGESARVIDRGSVLV
jgi:hypothetical protein